MKVYLDHAATTPLDEEVLNEMLPYLREKYGNPSSLYQQGSVARLAVENARQEIASLLNVQPAEIFFTSGGTEANHTIIKGALSAYKSKYIISSPIEHPSVLELLTYLQQQQLIFLHLVKINHQGQIDYESLEELLQQYPNALVSLMHGNNEIGNISNLSTISSLCKKYNAFFHTDTIQSIAYLSLDLNSNLIDACTASAHKFYGPKGIGFFYINSNKKIHPLFLGGKQERGMRAGTENVASIVGLAAAFKKAYQSKKKRITHLKEVKKYFTDLLQHYIPNINFNGMCYDLEKSLPHILNINLPFNIDQEMLLVKLDSHHISISAGSACSSGTLNPSHVLAALNSDLKKPSIRFSFGKNTTLEELNYVAKEIKKLSELS